MIRIIFGSGPFSVARTHHETFETTSKFYSPFPYNLSPTLLLFLGPVDSLKNVTERDRWKEVEVWRRRGRFS